MPGGTAILWLNDAKAMAVLLMPVTFRDAFSRYVLLDRYCENAVAD